MLKWDMREQRTGSWQGKQGKMLHFGITVVPAVRGIRREQSRWQKLRC